MHYVLLVYLLPYTCLFNIIENLLHQVQAETSQLVVTKNVLKEVSFSFYIMYVYIMYPEKVVLHILEEKKTIYKVLSHIR